MILRQYIVRLDTDNFCLWLNELSLKRNQYFKMEKDDNWYKIVDPVNMTAYLDYLLRKGERTGIVSEVLEI